MLRIAVSTLKVRSQQLSASRKLRWGLTVGSFVVGLILACQLRTLFVWADEENPSQTKVQSVRRQTVDPDPRKAALSSDPSKVIGALACGDCHESEWENWRHSAHCQGFEKLRSNPNAKGYAQKFGISVANITRNSICADCHGLRAADRDGSVATISGVACESCHGAAGGKDGWLNVHDSYGFPQESREVEDAEHRRRRIARSEQAGMIRPERIYTLASKCYRCHVVHNEQLVNDAGHSAGSDFELVSWLLGEVRHNFLLDPEKNAESATLLADRVGVTPEDHKRVLYVLGIMLDLEHSLRNLSQAKSNGTYARAMAGRVRSAFGALDEITGYAEVPEIDEVTQLNARLKMKLRPTNSAALCDAADIVATAAQRFVESHTGSRLADLDELIPTTYRGKTYKP